MSIVDALLGRREFLSPEKIVQFVSTSRNFIPDEEKPNEAGTMLIFETSNQHTWLVCTNKRLYCILDDIRRTPHLNWSMDRDKIIGDNDVKLEITVRPNSNRTGFIDFGPSHRDWYYSLRLFVDQTVKQDIQTFLLKHMT